MPPTGFARTWVLWGTVAALVFQLGHLLEHTLQMAIWMVHPQRGPWMSPWATELALTLGRIPAADSAEMTSGMQRGMEVLHLVGNAVFLVGALGLLHLASGSGASAQQDAGAVRWARAGVVLQGLHTLEHVLLTGSVFVTGRAVGLSTWFGALDGTTLSTQRVWWHGLVNLFASAVVGRAVWLQVGSRTLRTPMTSFPKLHVQPQSAVVASVAAVIVVPTAIAGWFGVSGSQPMHAHGAAPTALVALDAPPGLYDVATAVGLDVSHDAFHWDVSGDPVAMMGGGVCWIDVDQDGWLDLFITNTWSDGEWGLWNNGPGLPTTRLFRNVEGHFIEATHEWEAGFAVRAVGCTAADFDADGDTDLYVTTSRSNLLLLNQGGRFEDVGERSGADLYGWQSGAAAGDLDGDGFLDLFVAGYADLNAPRSDSDSGFPNTVEPLIDSILFGSGVVDGIPRFEAADVRQLGIEPDGFDYGLDVVLVDIDGDRDLDIHVANDTQANRLYRNDLSTAGVFVDVAPTTGIADEGSGMGVAIADVNGDAEPDLAVTNLAGQGHRMFVSSSTGWERLGGQFEAVGDVDTGWGVAFPDLDNDGALDAVIASGAIPIVEGTAPLPIRVLRGSDTDFSSWAFEDGAPLLPSVNGRGVAPADFDNDGDLDIAVTSVGGALVLLENRLAESNSLTVDLGAPVAGTEVVMTFDDDSVQTIRRWSGGHWLSAGDPRVHVGLGPHRRVVAVEVRWPGGASASIVVPSEVSSVSVSSTTD